MASTVDGALLAPLIEAALNLGLRIAYSAIESATKDEAARAALRAKVRADVDEAIARARAGHPFLTDEQLDAIKKG